METSDSAGEARHYLREWRLHLGLSLRDVARAMGTNKSVISRYETNTRAMKLEVQFELARALGIWVGQLFLPPDKPSTDAVLRDAPADVWQRSRSRAEAERNRSGR